MSRNRKLTRHIRKRIALGHEKRARSLPLPQFKRSCGECTACCTALAVEEIDKGVGVTCAHVCTKGCEIYSDRPKSCGDFSCLWLDGMFDLSERPDKLGIVWCYQKHEFAHVVETTTLTGFQYLPGAFNNPLNLELVKKYSEHSLVMLVSKDDRRVHGPPHLLRELNTDMLTKAQNVLKEPQLHDVNVVRNAQMFILTYAKENPDEKVALPTNVYDSPESLVAPTVISSDV